MYVPKVSKNVKSYLAENLINQGGNISSIDLAKRKGLHAWWHRIDNRFVKPCFIRQSALVEQRKYANLLKIEQNKITHKDDENKNQ